MNSGVFLGFMYELFTYEQLGAFYNELKWVAFSASMGLFWYYVKS